MHQQKHVLFFVTLALLAGGCATEMSSKKFLPTPESLQQYECPEWFRDAKFGIYLHWGVYSVAERGEWYPRQMYLQDRWEYKHHVETYGHPSEFGYKEFIPMWKAENFDPDRLVDLFKRAGAKYFTPCAVHHDNFDLWNSKHHKYNSVNMGPKKDITGMWRKAALKHGLRFGVTTHLARSYSWFQVNKGADKSGPYKGVPYDGNDPMYRDFYHEPDPDTNRKHPKNPPEHWRKNWAKRIKDLIDNYKPDHLYFDGAIPFQGDDQGKTGMEVMAYYFNQNMKWHGGRQEGVLCIKKFKDHGIYLEGVATRDMERRKAEGLMPEPWQTDDSIGPWGYHKGAEYKSVDEIIDKLVDIVSKNGNYLLNVPPKADGTLDAETEQILLGIGKWLDVNGEAVYGTRPWKIFGENDIRFTRKGKTLYAVALKGPEKKTIEMAALGKQNNVGNIAKVTFLGLPGRLDWKQDAEALRINLPPTRPCENAYSFKIEFHDL